MPVIPCFRASASQSATPVAQNMCNTLSIMAFAQPRFCHQVRHYNEEFHLPSCAHTLVTLWFLALCTRRTCSPFAMQNPASYAQPFVTICPTLTVRYRPPAFLRMDRTPTRDGANRNLSLRKRMATTGSYRAAIMEPSRAMVIRLRPSGIGTPAYHGMPYNRPSWSRVSAI